MSTLGDISYRTKWLVSKRYVQAAIVILLMTLGVAIPIFTPHRTFGAVTDLGCTAAFGCNFEVDGDIYHNSSATSTGLPADWGGCSTSGVGSCPTGRGLFDANGNTNPLPPGGLDAHWVNDGPHKVPDTSTFTTGSKDTLDITPGWQCVSSNNLTPKDDILHAYSYATVVPPSGVRANHTLLYGAFERFANNGAGDLGFWLLQDNRTGCPSGKGAQSFAGVHQTNDTLIVAEFSTGGSVTTVNTFRWVGISKDFPIGVANVTNAGGGDCTAVDASANICARSNTSPISTLPWSTQDKTSAPNTLDTAEFFEVGVDLTGIFGPNAPCINKFLFDTRTSPSLTATLMDYAIGQLTSCPKSKITTTVSPTVIALGGSATDTATVTNDPSSFSVLGTVTFNAYASLADCGAGTNSKFTDTKSISGPSPASVTSGPFTPLTSGTYYWIAAYTAASAQHGTPATTKCGDGNETLVVIHSSITTVVSPTPITLGGSASDTATVNVDSPGTVGGTVTFNAYASLADCGAGTNSKFTDTKSVSGSSPLMVTSASFTPTAPGTYYWIAAYSPTAAINGNAATTHCNDANETLVVFGIPKIMAFDFTNTPTNNDPTLGSGSVTYSFTIKNYGASTVDLGGTFTVSSPNGATVTCSGGNTLTLSGSLASGGTKTFNLSCTYSGDSGQKVEATIDATFSVGGGATHPVSGSPTTYSFTIQKT